MEITKKAYTFDDVLLMPRKSIVESRKDLDTTGRISKRYSLNLPVLSANMKTVTNSDTVMKMYQEGANGVLHRYSEPSRRVEEASRLNDYSVKPIVTSVGIKDDIQIIRALAEYSHVMILDVAHAHSESVMSFVKEVLIPLKETYVQLDIVIGNIATAQAAKDFAKLDVDGLKVGIGPGAACTTRIQTGVGVPQLSAIMDVYSVAKDYNIPIIADGGLRYPADICKAFIAGAESAMMGKEIAFTIDNTASDVDPITAELEDFFNSSFKSKKVTKKYYGSASASNSKNDFIEGADITKQFEIGELPSISGKLMLYRQSLQSMISYMGGEKLADIIGLEDAFMETSAHALYENGIRR